MVAEMTAPSSAGITLPAHRPRHHRFDLPATTLGTDELLAPIQDRSVRAISGSHLRGIGPDLMPAGFAPDD